MLRTTELEMQMLVLTRKKNERIFIGEDEIKVTIIEIQGDKVRIGIDAPKDISVHREEIYERIQKEGQQSAVKAE